MIKKLFLIFIAAFLLNLVWENLHSLFYVHYKSEGITTFILFRAALFDAAFITVLGFLFIKLDFLAKRIWLAAITSIIAAVLIELFALKTGRWAYNEFMPIIPLLNIGLTPAIQLGVLAYLIFKWQIKHESRN